MDRHELETAFNLIEGILKQLVLRTQAQQHHLTFLTLESLVFVLTKLKTQSSNVASEFNQRLQAASLTDSWNQLLSSELMELFLKLAAYQETARIDFKALLQGLKTVYRGTRLERSINQRLLNLATESRPYTSPKHWDDISQTRSLADKASLDVYNEALYDNDDPDHLYALWLSKLCERIHAYRFLANSLSEHYSSWPVGQALMHGLLKAVNQYPHPVLWVSVLALWRIVPPSFNSMCAARAYEQIKQERDALKELSQVSPLIERLESLKRLLDEQDIDSCPESSDPEEQTLIAWILNPKDRDDLNALRIQSFVQEESRLNAEPIHTESLTDFLERLWQRGEKLLGQPLSTNALLLLGAQNTQED